MQSFFFGVRSPSVYLLEFVVPPEGDLHNSMFWSGHRKRGGRRNFGCGRTTRRSTLRRRIKSSALIFTCRRVTCGLVYMPGTPSEFLTGGGMTMKTDFCPASKQPHHHPADHEPNLSPFDVTGVHPSPSLETRRLISPRSDTTMKSSTRALTAWPPLPHSSQISRRRFDSVAFVESIPSVSSRQSSVRNRAQAVTQEYHGRKG